MVTVPAQHVRAVERRAGLRRDARRQAHAALAARRPAQLLPGHARGRRLRDDRDHVARHAGRATTSQRGREADARAHARAHAARCSSCSRQQFGVPYPYPRYAQVFVADFIFGGMENTSATTLTDTVLLDERAALDYDVDALVAHELAHQWFGDLVTCRDWGEGWLNEGFATYCEYIWREHHEGRDAADLELEEWADMLLRRGLAAATAARSRPSSTTSRSTSSITTSTRRAGACCTCCATCSATTRSSERSRTTSTKHRHGVVESRDLARAVEDATGKSRRLVLQPVGDRRRRPPRARRRARVGRRRASSRPSTSSRRRRSRRTTPLFRVPTTRAVPRRRPRRRRARSRSPSRSHVFHVAARRRADAGDLRSRPRSCSRRARSTSPSRCGSPSSPARRSRSIARRGGARSRKRGGAAGRARARSTALAQDKFWAVRGAAAAGARRRSAATAARDALIKRARAPRSTRARAARSRARSATSCTTRRPAPRSRRSSSKGDASYFVEAEACLALGKTRTPRAGELLRERRDARVVHRRDPPARVSRARRGARRQRDRRCSSTACAGAGRRRAGAPRPARSPQLMRGRRDREARDVRERIELLLADRDFRVQAAAIEALDVIGDPGGDRARCAG